MTPHEIPLNLPEDPIQAFQAWFDDAVKAVKNDPTAMTLATADREGQPSARIVLFKGLSTSESGRVGIEFYTNYESPKSKQLSENPKAALVFYWPELNRQVRWEGEVEQLTHDESQVYFQSRPRGSQVGAWSSPQSQPIASRDELLKRVAQSEERFKNQDPLPCPPHWGGWRLIPKVIEFWQAGDFRLHDRARYEWTGSEWQISRLAP